MFYGGKLKGLVEATPKAKAIKELIIHDMIEVLPEPRLEPESEGSDGSESEGKSEESENKFKGENRNDTDIYSDNDDKTIPYDITAEPETFI
jgi:hypothetical protein